MPLWNNISTEKFAGVVGDFCSGSCLAIAPLAKASMIPMIAPSATNPLLTINGGPFFFRMAPSDVYQGKFLAGLASANNTKIAAIFGVNDAYALGIFNEVAASLSSGSYNASIVAAVGFDTTVPWMAGRLASIINSNATAIILCFDDAIQAGSAAVELRSIGFTGALFGPDSLGGQPVYTAAPYASAMEGFTSVQLYSGTSDFKALWKKMYGVPPPSTAAQTYDAFTAFAMTCANNGRINTGAVIQKLLTRPTFSINPAATGSISFQPNSGDIKQVAYDTVKVVNGTWVTL